jgi:hypothetical protein
MHPLHHRRREHRLVEAGGKVWSARGKLPLKPTTFHIAQRMDFGFSIGCQVYRMYYDYFDADAGDPTKRTGESLEIRIPKVMALIDQHIEAERKAHPTITTTTAPGTATTAAAAAATPNTLLAPSSVDAVLALINRMQAKHAPKPAVAGAAAPCWGPGAGELPHWNRIVTSWKCWNWSADNLQTLFVDQKREVGEAALLPVVVLLALSAMLSLRLVTARVGT